MEVQQPSFAVLHFSLNNCMRPDITGTTSIQTRQQKHFVTPSILIFITDVDTHHQPLF